MKKRAWVCGVLAAGLVGATDSDAASPGGTVALFFVSKSENKNQVAYEVRVDDSCRLVGDAPVYAYWRMLELGPTRTEPMLPIETPAYGIARQQILERGRSGGTVRVTLRALPDRAILVHTTASDGKCLATATTLIDETPAYLVNVHARISWPFGVASLLMTGWAESDGRLVRETLRP